MSQIVVSASQEAEARRSLEHSSRLAYLNIKFPDEIEEEDPQLAKLISRIKITENSRHIFRANTQNSQKYQMIYNYGTRVSGHSPTIS